MVATQTTEASSWWGDALCTVEGEFLVPGPGGVLVLSLQGSGGRRMRTLTWQGEDGATVRHGDWVVDLWAGSFSDRYWVNAEDGAVWVWWLNGDGKLQSVHHVKVNRPISLTWQRYARGPGIIVETSSDWEFYAVPHLRLLERGDVRRPPVQYPDEATVHASHGYFPTMPLGNPMLKPRVLDQDGRVLVELPAVAQGLAADSRQALVWAPVPQGVQFFWLTPGRKPQRFLLPDATQACARIQETRLLVGDDLGRILVFETT